MQRLTQTIKLVFTAMVIAVMGLVFSSNAWAGKITGLRIGQGIGSVRIVFDADSKFDYKVFTLSEPNRLVIDAQGVDVSPEVAKNKDNNIFVDNIRIGTVGVNGIRIVFDLKKPILIKKVFMLSPQSNFNWRFAIDLEATSEREFLSKIGNSHAVSSNDYNPADTSVSTKAAATLKV